MSKKVFAVLAAVALAVPAFFTGGCQSIEEMRLSRHESNSTDAYLNTTAEKLNAALEKVLPPMGYPIHKVNNTRMQGHYEAEGIEVTVKDTDIKDKVLMYIRIGSMGDKYKEKLVITALKKELGIKD
ncbi:MAG: hypothetical protein A2020_01125 [Lentisphaerae bacterium GWF2_45_14]|nr:MAG: hypothetical protein A2020_01125 [Lentisphaerae bacterium GWF2_45_14]